MPNNTLHSKLVSTVLFLTVGVFAVIFSIFFYITKQQLNQDNCERVSSILKYEGRDITAEIKELDGKTELSDSLLYSIITKHLNEARNQENTLYTFLSDSTTLYYYGPGLDKEGLAIQKKIAKKLPKIVNAERKQYIIEEGTYNFFYTYLPSIDRYYLAVTRDLDFMREVYMMGGIAVLLLLIFAGMLWGLLSRSVKSIVKPLRQLAGTAEKISGGDFFTNIPSEKSFTEICALRDSFTAMQKSLDSYMKNLEVTTVAKEKIENDLEIAHAIQMAMLPEPDSSLRIEAKLVPAREVGGDIYDYIAVGQTLYVQIADVSGKGVPAALVASSIQSIFRSMVSLGASPVEIVSAMNSVVSKNNKRNMFATVFVAKIDTVSREMAYCNAGHNPPFILAPVRKLAVAENLPVGLFESFEYSEQSEKLDGPLVLYTDGVVEAENSVSELLGEERFVELLQNHPAEGLAEAIFSLVRDFAGEAPQSDDITVLVIS